MQAWGHKVIWPGSSVIHWEIRRGFTVDGYSSKAFISMMQSAEDEVKQLGEKFNVTIKGYFDHMYKFSCLRLLDSRLDFYALSMPASSYRRTSVDFKFKGVENLRIGAFVNNDKPDMVWVNHGTVMAVEDAAQVLLALGCSTWNFFSRY